MAPSTQPFCKKTYNQKYWQKLPKEVKAKHLKRKNAKRNNLTKAGSSPEASPEEIAKLEARRKYDREWKKKKYQENKQKLTAASTIRKKQQKPAAAAFNEKKKRAIPRKARASVIKKQRAPKIRKAARKSTTCTGTHTTNFKAAWNGVERELSLKANNNGLEWLNNKILAKYKRQFLHVHQFDSIEELVLKSLKVVDIDPKLCTRTAPTYTIHHTLSYFREPEPFIISTLIPSWTSSTGRSVHFDATAVQKVPELFTSMCNVRQNSIPDWLRRYNAGLYPKWSKKDLVDKIHQETCFFDPFPVSVNGTDYSGGLIPITASAQAGPRRLNLSDKFDEPKYCPTQKCHIFEGYSYTLSFCTSFHYYGRPFDHHPAIADLKIKVWKHLRQWLTPVSQVCPPNGAQVLVYFKQFDGKINAHKDMNPRMAVDTDTNSQLVGSSVVVVNLLASQWFEFCEKVPNKNEFYAIDKFLTEDCSVYVMDSEDDLEWYHRTKFPVGTRSHSARVSITFRWLAKRMSFFGEDYDCRDGNRVYAQTVAPLPIIKSFTSKAKRNAYLKFMNLKK